MNKNRWFSLLSYLALATLLVSACQPTAVAPTAKLPPTVQPSLPPVPTQEPVKTKDAVIVQPEAISLTIDDAGKTIHLLLGQALVVTLDANPSTGFTWDDISVDKTILALQGEPIAREESKLLGAPLKLSLTFKPLAEGQQVLTLAYHRPWEKNDLPHLATFEVTVVVSGKYVAPTPDPKAQPISTPVVYPAAGMKGWATYSNKTYGFSLQYPAEWKLEDGKGTLVGHAIYLTPNKASNVLVQIAFKCTCEPDPIGRTGIGSGELVTLGKVLFVGKELVRQVLVSDNKHMTILYTDPGKVVRADLEFALYVDYRGNWTDAGAIPPEVETLADLVVASLRLDS